MSRPLTHRPFAELEPTKPEVTVIRRRTTDPESGLKLVRQIRATPLPEGPPPNARLTPDPTEGEPDSVAAKKRPGQKGYKRSPESIAKQKATLAKKKRSKKRASKKVGTGRMGEKAAFVRAHPSVAASDLVKLAAKEGIKLNVGYIYNVRSVSKDEAPTRAPKTQRQSHGPSSNGASIGDLLQAIVEATTEIQRRLSQLTL